MQDIVQRQQRGREHAAPPADLLCSGLEYLLHRVFADVRLKINQTGTDGRGYDVTEWFEVPLPVINQAVELITTGDIIDYTYNAATQSLEPN